MDCIGALLHLLSYVLYCEHFLFCMMSLISLLFCCGLFFAEKEDTMVLIVATLAWGLRKLSRAITLTLLFLLVMKRGFIHAVYSMVKHSFSMLSFYIHGSIYMLSYNM